MLNPNPGLILWTIFTFLILLVILRKFAWKPLMESLHKREETVRSSIERAETARQDAERLLEENRKQLARAEEKVKLSRTPISNHAAWSIRQSRRSIGIKMLR